MNWYAATLVFLLIVWYLWERTTLFGSHDPLNSDCDSCENPIEWLDQLLEEYEAVLDGPLFTSERLGAVTEGMCRDCLSTTVGAVQVLLRPDVRIADCRFCPDPTMWLRFYLDMTDSQHIGFTAEQLLDAMCINCARATVSSVKLLESCGVLAEPQTGASPAIG